MPGSSPQPLRFSIVIVSWNALHHLQQYLPSVAATDYPDYEIVLADNHSTDGSAEWVRKHYPQVKIASLDKNFGYCGGNNRGALQAEGDILLFLNNDVEVEPDWLHGLNRCFRQHEKVAAVQPKMKSHREPDYFEYAGAAGGYIDKYGYPFCRGRIFDTLEQDRGQYDTPADILWASGAALAVRADLFDELGGFDEDFEFHMEEIDLCWRLWNRGYRIRYCPDSTVYHLGGGSLPMHSPRKTYYNFRNNLVMLWKNYSPSALRRRFFLRMVLDGLAAFKALFSGNAGDFFAIFKAHMAFYRRWPSAQGKRRDLNRLRTVQEDPGALVPINLVWQYFARGRKTFDRLPLPDHLKEK